MGENTLFIFFCSMRQRNKQPRKVKNESCERADILQLTGDLIQQKKHGCGCDGGKQRPDTAYMKDMSPVAIVEVHTRHIHVEHPVHKHVDVVFIIVGWQSFRCKQPEIGSKQNA